MFIAEDWTDKHFTNNSLSLENGITVPLRIFHTYADLKIGQNNQKDTLDKLRCTHMLLVILLLHFASDISRCLEYFHDIMTLSARK